MTESQRIRQSIKRDNQRRGLRGIVTKSTDAPIPTAGESVWRRCRAVIPARWVR